MMDHNSTHLLTRFDDAFKAHQHDYGDDTVFDALWALAFFAGLILAEAPEGETRANAHQYFVHALNDGLTHHNHATRH